MKHSARLAVRLIALGAVLAVAAQASWIAYQLYAFPKFPLRENFSEGFSHWPYAAKQWCCSYSVTQVAAPELANQSAVAMEIDDHDPLVRGANRAEFRLGATRFHQPYHYQFKLYIPADWQADAPAVTVMQMHNVPNFFRGPAGALPPLELTITGEFFSLRARHGNAPSWANRQIETHTQELWLGRLKRGEWISWDISVRWSTGADGLLEVAQNGNVIANIQGPNTYPDLVAPYLKLGVYAPQWVHPQTPHRIGNRRLYMTDVVAEETEQ